MESASSWQYKALINELTQGMEQTKQLGFHLHSTSSSEAQDLLLRRILSSYDNALLILQWNGQAQPAVVAPESSVTIDGSPKSEEVNKSFGDHQENITPKKRKLQPVWSEQVRVNPENIFEGPKEDGFSWRKYGQKDILGAKFPRSYYRCTYRQSQRCWAIKQVQRSDNDQTIFEITYKGTHTCNLSKNAIPRPEKQEKSHCDNSHNHQQQQQNQTLLNLKANLKVNTEDLNKEVPVPVPVHFSFPSTDACHDRENYYFPNSGLVDDENKLDTFLSFFYSPDTSESDYFSAATYQMQNYGEAFQHSGTEIAEIISAHASTTNSPIGSLDFSVDTADIDPNFPFNRRGFFN